MANSRIKFILVYYSVPVKRRVACKGVRLVDRSVIANSSVITLVSSDPCSLSYSH